MRKYKPIRKMSAVSVYIVKYYFLFAYFLIYMYIRSTKQWPNNVAFI